MPESTLIRTAIISIALVGLITCGTYRAAVATRLDSFMLDEYYHLAAGVSYIDFDDYRVNPEHPPLVKLWVGKFLSKSFQMPALRKFADKVDERHFTADAVYFKNDPDLVQSQVRTAMFLLSGLLLFLLSLAIWQSFGPVIAIAALTFLVIDPTVAAHLPLVMTDLPVALLASTAVLLSFTAFRTWRLRDLVLAGLALGLTLLSKHSSLVVVGFTAAMGIVTALRSPSITGAFLKLAGVLTVAWIVLWAAYGFRFTESSTNDDVFNRSTMLKVEDLQSPFLRTAMSVLVKTHFAPRSYLWGLADTLRAGVEGRPYPVYFLDREYIRRLPWHFFPVQIASKLPVGLLLLAIGGIVLLLLRMLPAQFRDPLWALAGFGGVFLLTIVTANSGYAGVRHALPAYPVCAVFGGCTVFVAIRSKNRMAVASVGLAVAAAMVSAMPIVRPWEYRNEIFGGAAAAYIHFSDEGVDVGQRTKELASYYHEHLEPVHEQPYVAYSYYLEDEFQRRGIQTLNQYWNEHEDQDKSATISGTVIVGANILSAGSEIGLDVFRSIQPTERYGNLLIFRGTFDLPKQRSWRLYLRGLDALYAAKSDPVKAERLFQEALSWNRQAYASAIELGNLQSGRGAREEAVRSFEIARAAAHKSEPISEDIARHIEQLEKRDPRTVPPLHNPLLE